MLLRLKILKNLGAGSQPDLHTGDGSAGAED